ncbi:MAG: head maturation protease, ClpP-related [Pseudoramibacter sp.]
MNKCYLGMAANKDTLEVFIFDDIDRWATPNAKDLAEMVASTDAENIDIHINSFGGDVSEGLAIYNTLINSGKHIRTFCDGFACSVASLIFMAGDERVMNELSLLMIHNPWTQTTGNADDMKKQAEVLEQISGILMAAYEKTGLSSDEIKSMMDAETWLDANDAKEKGFATEIQEIAEPQQPAASTRAEVFLMCKSTLKLREETPRNDDIQEIKKDVVEILDKVSKLTVPQPQKAPESKKDAEPPEASNSILAFFDKFTDPE